MAKERQKTISLELVWKKIKDYEEYQVSNTGLVKRYGRCLKLVGKGGNPKYKIVDLSKRGKSRQYYVHRLVAKAFILNPEDKPHINHKDLDPSNNHVTNLEWCTPSENTRHAHKHGHCADNRGSKHGMSKLTEEQVIEIKMKLQIKAQTVRTLADQYNVSEQAIYDIKNKKRWGWLAESYIKTHLLTKEDA